MTVSGLMTMLENDYGVELSMLSSGVTILYSDFMDRKKMAVSACFVVFFCSLPLSRRAVMSLPKGSVFLFFLFTCANCRSCTGS